ncbi:MAG: nuclear transport factor 2 family protein [Candidatus Methylomirabilia bacterium]
MDFDGEAFIKQFMVEWVTSGTRPDGTRFEAHGCDILTLRDGKITAKRAYRKSAL